MAQLRTGHRRRNADCGSVFHQEQGRERNPEMHQVRKGKQWYCGMKAHMAVDAESKLIHSVAAN